MKTCIEISVEYSIDKMLSSIELAKACKSNDFIEYNLKLCDLFNIDINLIKDKLLKSFKINSHNGNNEYILQNHILSLTINDSNFLKAIRYYNLLVEFEKINQLLSREITKSIYNCSDIEILSLFELLHFETILSFNYWPIMSKK